MCVCVFLLVFFFICCCCCVVVIIVVVLCVCGEGMFIFYLFFFFGGGGGLGKGVYNYHSLSQLMFWVVNPFMPNGISYCYQVDQPISVVWVVGR